MHIFKIITTLFLIILLPQCSISFFRSSYNNVINKAKAYYKSNYGKDKTWHFLGYDPSEYPGTNEKYRDISRQKWNEYYNCLNIQNENLGVHLSVTPEAVQGFEGASIRFDCKICLNPNERSKIDAVEWYWAPLSSKLLIPVEFTEHILLSPEDKTLSLYNLQVDQTGQYMCKLGESLTAPYFLTVVNSTINVTEVHTEFGKMPFPAEPNNISEYNLVVDTVWGDWSPCSTCGKAGKRHKFGYCVVFMQQLENCMANDSKSTNLTSSNVTKTNINVTTQNVVHHPTKTTESVEKASEEIPKSDLELLQIFKNGVPCLSHILPESIKNLPVVKNRSNEIMVGYCKTTCPDEAIFEVKDKEGHVIERANNSAGIYSMYQGMPSVEPAVERLLLYERMGEHVVLTCPGNLNSDAPIQWQMGSKKLVPELIVQQSVGRIYISVMDKINIKKAKISDSNIYSCWQHNELAGTIRLVVEKKVKLTFNHHIMLFGMVIIMSVFVYVFTKAFFGKKYARIVK